MHFWFFGWEFSDSLDPLRTFLAFPLE